jgi:hypothetical protein
MNRAFIKFFRILLGLAGLGVIGWAAYTVMIRPWHLRWGASDAEVAAVLPGDDLVPQPDGVVINRAITINAPAAQVWPWLVQLGAEKGGLYSYTGVESLLNCPLVNADRIGDLVKMCPSDSGPPPFVVAAILPEQALVLGHLPITDEEKALAGDWFSTWALVLEKVDDDTTRLIARSRDAKKLAWMNIIEPGVFVMERGMLLGIKARAEQ